MTSTAGASSPNATRSGGRRGSNLPARRRTLVADHRRDDYATAESVTSGRMKVAGDAGTAAAGGGSGGGPSEEHYVDPVAAAAAKATSVLRLQDDGRGRGKG
jgi:hypothetical protein